MPSTPAMAWPKTRSACSLETPARLIRLRAVRLKSCSVHGAMPLTAGRRCRLSFESPPNRPVAAGGEHVRVRRRGGLRADDVERDRRQHEHPPGIFSRASLRNYPFAIIGNVGPSHRPMILARRCAVSSASRTNAPNCPLLSAAFQSRVVRRRKDPARGPVPAGFRAHPANHRRA